MEAYYLSALISARLVCLLTSELYISVVAELMEADNSTLEARIAQLRSALEEREALLEEVTGQLKALHGVLSTWEGFNGKLVSP